MNVILGSGIVGLMAKVVLPDWTIIPFYRSRFYSFNPPLADNFITSDDEIDHAIRDLCVQAGIDKGITAHQYRRCYSVNGALVNSYDSALTEAWLAKVFGSQDKVPGHALPYYSTRMTSRIYGVRTSELYSGLLRRYMTELKEEASRGPVTEVGDHYLVRGGIRLDFNNAISTIPLPELAKLSGMSTDLHALDEHFMLVSSRFVDLEGHNQSLVVDRAIDFYKVTVLSPGLFMFCSTVNMRTAGSYLMSIIGNADIIDGSFIKDAIPAGQAPPLPFLERYGIFTVGSHAQWDWCADVGSNLLRIIRYGSRNYKPK